MDGRIELDVRRWGWVLGVGSAVVFGCSSAEPQDDVPNFDGDRADVLAVQTDGNPGAYTFAVTARSPDTGCDQYADWWEVITPDGELLYRRILAHSHVDEQPFTRSGGPVDVQSTTRVIVRVHMNDAGYGGAAMEGSPGTGFTTNPSVTTDLAPELADAQPQPSDCAF